MGKREKKQQRHQQRGTRREPSHHYTQEEEEDVTNYSLPSSSSLSNQEPQEEEKEGEEEEEENDPNPSTNLNMPSKFQLYQQSVQSPKGDISYLQKFFLMYVGGRQPLHFQEDFCGTALLSTEWLRSDPRRTAIGLDLDPDALSWCLKNNLSKVGFDGYCRISLFHGNVLQPLEAKLVKFDPHEPSNNIRLDETDDSSGACVVESTEQEGFTAPSKNICTKRNYPLPARDIVCAFNYSCCCLHKRADLLLYFRNVVDVLSKKGGIFVMDLYGGMSSEHKLTLRRKFPNFTYVWEQDEFDIIERKTRISLHFHLQKQQRKLRHAFSYSWRLWSLPEIKDCLEEAGFRSVHFWLRQMTDTEDNRNTVGFGAGQDIKYEEVRSFQQVDAWNAYIVGVV
ncbi:hypothetical protein CFOL_v3_25322 [Cephalotus follicularis]|uniref:Uncharacterized protein n=1 Tax=Cephalotus follicularis TaxID=3775 RepID=A0A1Q3CNM6_CEPFO|nr:hypothetical protein CFOL_v3_25322 [Cephalotus follicularis]